MNKKFKMKSKKAAMEMSIGTIVVVVLSITMLILGVMLIRGIFSKTEDSTNAVFENLDSIAAGLGNDENAKMIITPTSQKLAIKIGESETLGVGIMNRLSGTESKDALFSYEINVVDDDIENRCGFTPKEAQSWIIVGRKDSDVKIKPGELGSFLVEIEIPKIGSTPCIFKTRVLAQVNGEYYAREDVIIDITD